MKNIFYEIAEDQFFGPNKKENRNVHVVQEIGDDQSNYVEGPTKNDGKIQLKDGGELM